MAHGTRERADKSFFKDPTAAAKLPPQSALQHYCIYDHAIEVSARSFYGLTDNGEKFKG
jgi:hypothetical protein